MIIRTYLVIALSVITFFGCGTDDTLVKLDAKQADTAQAKAGDTALGALNPALFIDGALTEAVVTEDCTLSDGTQTSCYRITIAGAPKDDSPVGPYCPESIDSTAKDGGTWIDGVDTLYDVDGAFIANLATLYNDSKWQMYDPATGLVDVISGAQGCEVAGVPENNTGRDNFCLECSIEALDGGIERTALIPVTPVMQAAVTRLGRTNIGIALNGVLLGPPAPLDLILGGYTLGLFDDCGGHANPREGYHYHAANGCSEIGAQADGHAPMIGYALDGYAIYARLDETRNPTTGLDECGGITDEVRGYHYHASLAGANKIIGCFKGAQGSFDGEEGGGPQGGRPPRGERPDGPPPEGAPPKN